MLSSKSSWLTVSFLIATGSISQALPSFAQTAPAASDFCRPTLSYDLQSQHSGLSPRYICKGGQLTTKTFNTPKGDGVFIYDTPSQKLTYALGDPGSSFYSLGTFQMDMKSSTGASVGLYTDNGSKGTFSQAFPIATQSFTQPGTGTSANYGSTGTYPQQGGAYTGNGSTGNYSQQFNPSSFQSFGQSDYSGAGTQGDSSFTGTVTRPFSTPKGDGVYTYDGSTHSVTYSIGDPNDPFYFNGGFYTDPVTHVATSYGNYKENGNTGSFTSHFGGSNSEAVPEPDSALLNTLAVGVVIGSGLMLKRQQKKRKAVVIDISKD